jgi:archaeosine-15-forming tRNA-guanine transglycosylase
MFLHLGSDILVNKNKIICIFNLETTATKLATEKLLKNLKKTNHIKNISKSGKEKSLIITTDGYFFSPISSITLLKRSLNIIGSEE